MNARRLVLGVCLIATTTTWVESQKRTVPPPQDHFSAEDETLPNPVPLPNDVLALLEKEKRVQDALQNENPPGNKVPASWFSATEVHLSSQAQPDLVVRAEPPLSGANIDYFWVVRNTASGHALVLAAPAHDLEIRAGRSNGYRDIEMVAMTSREIHTVLYRFDGQRYVVYREKTEPIR